MHRLGEHPHNVHAIHLQLQYGKKNKRMSVIYTKCIQFMYLVCLDVSILLTLLLEHNMADFEALEIPCRDSACF